MTIRAGYQALDSKDVRRPVITINKEPTMTKKSMAEQLDVNNIVKKYNQTGVLQKMTQFEGVYGEFDSMDMRDAINKVERATELFMEVPSEIRGKFENDAGAFIDYATNPQNIDQMRDWGLAEPRPEVPTKTKPALPTGDETPRVEPAPTPDKE